jgi:hypothetical protein
MGRTDPALTSRPDGSQSATRKSDSSGTPNVATFQITIWRPADRINAAARASSRPASFGVTSFQLP